ncbi:TVP38/TMEM64 family protein [Niallia sp. Krafla_26]|uniref:TVP38/TMEM64 family protein n=1 Tax=Niallia sp. Krafla_26 TaxID=3064703 RepID=UPI003D1825F4
MTLDWISLHPFWASLISILLNVFVAITGILPSAFITVATVGLFDLKYALLLLIIGEALGAIVSFILYRKGIRKLLSYPKMETINKNKYIQKLRNTDGVTAVFIILFLRVLPFVPSGAVTLAAALSPIHVLTFSLASTTGKIPALFIEAYSIAHVLTMDTKWQLFIILLICLFYFLYVGFKKWKEKK